MTKYPLIRKIYLYLFALIGLVLITVGCVKLVGLTLKTFVFTKADIYYEYPMARPVKPPVPEGQETELQQPGKEEVEEYQKNQRTSQRQREAAEALAMIIVGLPLYLYHWRIIKNEKDPETGGNEG
ncbi:hypothetical protein A2W39_00590 [Candidatus Azambacteria bacterium RIFCSPHIGHO2_01_46_10]|uniref:DUF5671 domain-containing protein n=3 Tax=Candidatus Azamiibacteriota TaxID=1752741 RepID=A0A1F5C9D2_9BACT|nr:MAG: hypothetical protein A2W60_03510 [Candidatus Azambacteria bacterium RIFCSPHIGHO2_02_46_12]OGD35762.1 MAG: hypothetical protein A2W39_00590 [Candidatus Azambacteria bacterium RIFCSPHIGHO2_01_46_10]OGD39460.1 MAG: hypothetical protein A3A25_02070 [Candidatus Azambacteria bacterium RIFCSPLOWO2_01_FULL_46_26]